MAVDLRQVVAGILTITMFVMLGNMIKRDHFDSAADAFVDDASDSDIGERLSEIALSSFGKNGKGPWIDKGADLKSCWDSSSLDDVEESSGFVSFSLTSGPEYHVSQVSDAVAVARYLGAELIIPDVRGTVAGDTRKFDEVYDVDNFVKALNGVVRVREELPSSAGTAEVVKIPNRVNEDFISDYVEPRYRQQKSIRLATYFPTVNMRKFGNAGKTNSDKAACMGMFGSLKPVTEIGETVEQMVGRMREMGRSSEGRFVAVDLRVEMLQGKGCLDGAGAIKSCFSAQEIAVFLRKVGFNKDTVVYVTQSKWVDELEVLKDIFPKTYTKESVMEASKKSKYMDSELERVVDFYICSESDVFVPAISGLFYANVVGQRIANGKTEVLVPSSIAGTSAPVANHLSPYISKRTHLAYSCYC